MTIGERIQTIRQRRGMTQEELAEKLGSTKQVISRYERNAREPKAGMLADIAAALGCTIDDLYSAGKLADPSPENGLAQRLKALRLERGMTTNQVGESIGVNGKTVSGWEHNRSRPNADLLVALAKLFGCTMDELLGTLPLPSSAKNCIAARMEALGYSFMDLEKKTGIPHSALQRYSAGKTKKIPADRLLVLADALQTTPDELLGKTSPSPAAMAGTDSAGAYPPACDIGENELGIRIGRVFEPINPNYLKMSQLSTVMRLYNRFQENPDSLSREEKQYLMDLLEHCIIALSSMQYIIERNGEVEVKEDGGAGRAVQL